MEDGKKWVGPFYSESLKMRYNMRSDDPHIIYVQDDKVVKYNPNEINILKNSGITQTIHRVKKIFSGEIVRHYKSLSYKKDYKSSDNDFFGFLR